MGENAASGFVYRHGAPDALSLIKGRSFGDEYSALLSLFNIVNSPKLKDPKNAICKILNRWTF